MVEDICLVEEKKNGNGKGGSYLKTKSIWLAEKKKKREGKGGQLLKKGNMLKKFASCSKRGGGANGFLNNV